MKRNYKSGWRATSQMSKNTFDERHPIRGTFCNHEERGFATTRNQKSALFSVGVFSTTRPLVSSLSDISTLVCTFQRE